MFAPRSTAANHRMVRLQLDQCLTPFRPLYSAGPASRTESPATNASISASVRARRLAESPSDLAFTMSPTVSDQAQHPKDIVPLT